MESGNHDNFPVVKRRSFTEEMKKKKERSLMTGGETTEKKTDHEVKRRSYYEESMQQIKEEGRETTLPPPREPRWSDENLAIHIWRGVCERKGVELHEYVLRTDYPNMTREEIKLDILWRKVYEAAEAGEAPTASITSF